MTKIYNIGIMIDEKNLIKNPAQGEIITASSSNVKGKRVERISEAEIEANIEQIEKVINTQLQITNLEIKEKKIKTTSFTCNVC